MFQKGVSSRFKIMFQETILQDSLRGASVKIWCCKKECLLPGRDPRGLLVPCGGRDGLGAAAAPDGLLPLGRRPAARLRW